MNVFKSLSLKAKAAAKSQSSARVPSLSSAMAAEGSPNAKTFRNHVTSNSFLNAAVTLRKSQASSADWEVLPKIAGTDISPALKAVQQKIVNLLEAPNPDGRNQSFSALIEPVVDDILTLGFGAMMPTRNMAGEVVSLHHIDAARVRFLPNWNSNDDGPRYMLMNDDGFTGKPLMNHELITPILNPTTYNETGWSPVMVLHDKLQAFKDAFNSSWVIQKNRMPAGFLNLDGMPDEEMRKIEMFIEAELQGNSTLGLLNHPKDDVSFIEIGSVDLEKQGAKWFLDFIVTQICSVFAVSPISIQVIQDANRSLAREELRITGDYGIVPLMKTLAGSLNTEVLRTYKGAETLEFVWSELIVKDQAQSADTIRKRAGDRTQWTTRNELRRADGLEPMHTNVKDPLYGMYNEVMIWVATGQEAPANIAINLPQYLSADDVHKQKMLELEANRGANGPSQQSAENPPADSQGKVGPKNNQDQSGSNKKTTNEV